MPCAEIVVVFCAGGHKRANAVVVLCSNSKPIGGGGGDGGGQQQGRGKPQMRLASELAGRRRWFCWLSSLAGWLEHRQVNLMCLSATRERGGPTMGGGAGGPRPFISSPPGPVLSATSAGELPRVCIAHQAGALDY